MPKIPVRFDDHDHDHVIDLNPRPWRRALKISFIVAAIVAVMSATAARSSELGRPVGSSTGIATVARPGCAADAYKVPFTLIGSSDEQTLGMRPLSVGVECQGLSYGTLTWYSGSFDPRVGGCLYTADGNGRVCLGPTSRAGLQTGVAFELCFGVATCWKGTAEFART
ncbi:MAG: hypothetical protein ACLGH3_06265 [Actinomycetota bacterium]